MFVKDKLYNYFVRRNARVWYEYERYVREHIDEHHTHRLAHLKVLFKLNWFYRIKKGNTPYLYWDVPMDPKGNIATVSKKDISPKVVKNDPVVMKGTQIKTIQSESICEKRPDKKDLISVLERYDVISFDLFDTLIFRCFDDPKDVFAVLGYKLKIPNFKKIRIEAESAARKKKRSKEVTFENIYAEIEKKIKLNVQEAIEKEIEIEIQACFANSYMLEIYNYLIEKGKKVIITSNMYMSSTTLNALVLQVGGFKPYKIFVSCEYQKNKMHGNLQSAIMEELGADKTYIHIGDNYFLDVEGSRCAGWKAIHYRNINEIGRSYRTFESKYLSNSIASALINANNFSGIIRDKYFEYGYSYVGYLIYGYCKWLNRMAKVYDVDKFLFASRDMFIVNKVYSDMFNNIPSEYVKVSRTATIRIVFEGFVQHYLDWHVKRRINSNNTIQCVLEELQLEFLLQNLCKYDLCNNEILCKENYEKLQCLIEDNKDTIGEKYKKDQLAAKKYFETIVNKNQTICLVDMGWKSSTANCLNYFFNVVNDWNINVLSAMIGMEGHDYVQEEVDFNLVQTFIFSNLQNTDIREIHNSNGTIWRRLYEIIFTSNEKSLLAYDLDDEGMCCFNYLRPEYRDKKIVDQIHAGIYEFCKDYKKFEDRLGIDMSISGRDAYFPLMNIFCNKEYNYEMFKDFEVCFIAGNVKEENAELFSAVSGKE